MFRVFSANYKPNTRESFRKNALSPLVGYNIIDLNPDDPNLKLNSPKTHYAIKEGVLNLLKTFGSNKFETNLKNFYRLDTNPIFLRKIIVKNFKSLVNNEIELGNFNLFIGNNGSGKSNLLEAITFIGASKASELTSDNLYSRGFRIAKPSLILNSFKNKKLKEDIVFDLEFISDNEVENIYSSFSTPDSCGLISANAKRVNAVILV